MFEVLNAAIQPVNLFPTFLLVLILVYWLTVIVGLSDVSTLDFDFEVDTPEVDAEVHGSSMAWLNSVLGFFNLGKVPFMIFLSFLALPFWVFSVLANHYLHNNSVLVAMFLMLAAFVASLFVAKFLTAPFVKVFAALDNDTSEGEKVIGRVCTVMLPVRSGNTGQAQLQTNGAPVLLNVRTPDGKQLEKGKTALVLQYNEKDRYYLVEPYDM